MCNDYFGDWMMVKAPSLEPGALLAALCTGNAYPTQRPEIHAIDVDGDAVTVECSPPIR